MVPKWVVHDVRIPVDVPVTKKIEVPVMRVKDVYATRQAYCAALPAAFGKVFDRFSGVKRGIRWPRAWVLA